MIWWDKLKLYARKLRLQTLVAWFAARDDRAPLTVRLLALVIAAYAISPIDLIPDFIPVLGLLDDLILVPLGIALVIRLVPKEVLISARACADQFDELPVSTVAGCVVVVFWVLLLVWAACRFSQFCPFPF